MLSSTNTNRQTVDLLLRVRYRSGYIYSRWTSLCYSNTIKECSTFIHVIPEFGYRVFTMKHTVYFGQSAVTCNKGRCEVGHYEKENAIENTRAKLTRWVCAGARPRPPFNKQHDNKCTFGGSGGWGSVPGWLK